MEKSEKKSVALISVLASLFLVTFKLIVGIITGSLSIISEALDSSIDSIASIITFVAVHISDKPADNEHNFGHGKVENLSAFFETILLFFISGWIVYHAVNNLITGSYEVNITIWSYIVIITSIVVDFSRVRKMKKVAKETNSQALEADAANFTADMISCVFVLIGLIFVNLGYHMADSIAALIVSVIILRIAIKMGKKSINVLIDRAPEGQPEIVKTYLNDNNINFHSLKMRTSGADTFINFNVFMKPDMTVLDEHSITKKLEDDIKNLIPRSIILIDVEPDNVYEQ